MRIARRLQVLLGAFACLVSSSNATRAAVDDDDGPDRGQPESCPQPIIAPEGSAYLNGLALIEEDLELVGDAVKVTVETPPRCRIYTPTSLPFRWQLTGPSGPVALTQETTLRPHFRPTVRGAYQAKLTYCPRNCRNVAVGGNTTIDIAPQTVTIDFNIASELTIPPESEPLLTPEALQEGPNNVVDADLSVREIKCGHASWSNQLVVVKPWSTARDYQLLEGVVAQGAIAGHDNELNHYSHDIAIQVVPDPRFNRLKVPNVDNRGKWTMEVEWESDYFRRDRRPVVGDRISAIGFHTYDCHHSDDTFGILTEIHPPVLTAVHRRRPIRIPDNWAPGEGQSLGTNIYVPGIVTDVWANKRAGEMTSGCYQTGLHQAAEPGPPPYGVKWGACIQSLHPMERAPGEPFTFNIYLPPDPQKRVAAVGFNAPPAPLYLKVEPNDGRVKAVRAVSGDVTYIQVSVDLNGYAEQEYAARITAGWVSPSTDNWGLERWKVGITTLDILDDHDPLPGDDGDWVFWAAINNTDRSWTRLVDGEDVTGTHRFDGRPYETEAASPDRSLGSHVLLFHPRSTSFPGLPQTDPTQSLVLHTSGYDAELWDDPTGSVNRIRHLDPASLAVGGRSERSEMSSSADYRLHYFVQRLGAVAPALTSAGQALVSAYTLRPHGARCTRINLAACVLFPERAIRTSDVWHPLFARVSSRVQKIDWSEFPNSEAQELEERGFVGAPLSELGASIKRTRSADAARIEQFVVDLREQFKQGKGAKQRSELAKALPALEATLPTDLWQRYFGDIDPTPVDLAVQSVKVSPASPVAGAKLIFAARIVNKGTGAAGAFSVQSYLDRSPGRALAIESLAPGAELVVEFPEWTATAGNHILAVTADALSRIAEPIERNNTREREFTVAPP